jgi:hypothetical protein
MALKFRSYCLIAALIVGSPGAAQNDRAAPLKATPKSGTLVLALEKIFQIQKIFARLIQLRMNFMQLKGLRSSDPSRQYHYSIDISPLVPARSHSSRTEARDLTLPSILSL